MCSTIAGEARASGDAAYIETSDLSLRELAEQQTRALGGRHHGRDMASIVWVKPSLVAQVAFTEWTDGGALRHARFIDLRIDKRAADVVREG
jgi:bifunctional non-homologous end joining protein LigD